MSKFDNYFADVGLLVKCLRKGEGREWTKGNFLFSRTDVGVCSVYRFFGVPFFTLQYNPNFKKKLYWFGRPLLTWSRAPLKLDHGHPYKIETDRKKRIYIHIGGLPYFDNGSGIPRVAKKLSDEGLRHHKAQVLPVYPDPRDGTYRIALNWIGRMGYQDPCLNGIPIQSHLSDPAMTIREGDWFIHTMINPNELDYEDAHLQAMRQAGVKIGFILHDIIAERYPKYFRKRDAKNFSRWLRKIGNFDGLFAVSRATLNDYALWCKEQGLPLSNSSLQWFHLGADFKKERHQLTKSDEDQLTAIKGKNYYMQVSTIEPRKGYKQLLEAFDYLWKTGSELCLVIVGRKGWLVDDLCRQIKKHPQLNTKLFWLSGVSDELLVSLYENSKAVVVASENEGFGLSVAEGAFYKKPLLLRDIPVFREIVEEKAFYFKGLDGMSLAYKIQEMDSTLNKNDGTSEAMSPIPNVPSWSKSFEGFYQLLNK